MIHNLKIEEGYLHNVLMGGKKAEIRFNDRDYQVGDILHFEPNHDYIVTHIHSGLGLKEGYVCLSVETVGATRKVRGKRIDKWNSFKEDICITGIGEYAMKEGNEIIKCKDLISKSMDLSKYQTVDVDYTGCHPVIAEALRQGKYIKCRVRDNGNWEEETVLISLYTKGMEYPYLATTKYVFKQAEPLLKKKQYYKRASDIMKWLEENDYSVDEEGTWTTLITKNNKFVASMWQYCEKEVPEKMHWIWHPEWIEEK